MSKVILLVEEKNDKEFLCASDKAYELLGETSYEHLLDDYRTHNYHTYIDYLYNNNYEIQTPDEYIHNSEIPVFYFVKIAITQDHLNPLWINGISKKSLKILIDHEIPIILSQPKEYFLDLIDNENPWRPSSITDLLDKKLVEVGLFKNNLIIHGIVKNFNDIDYFSTGQRKIFLHYSYYFFEKAKIMLQEENNFCMPEDHIVTEKNKIALCLNRQPRELRCLLLSYLVNHIENSIFTMLAEEPLHNELSSEQLYEVFENNINLINNEDLKKSLLDRLDIFKEKYPEYYRIKEIENETKNHAGINYKINDARKKVLFELVTETHSFKHQNVKVAIITEKTLWPILNHLPFTVLGHQYNLKFLKQLGFNVFEEWLLYEYQVSENIEEIIIHCDNLFKKYITDKNMSKMFESCVNGCKENYLLLKNTDWKNKEKEDLIRIFRS